ncbi:MAG: hypothetical protein Q8L20_03060 [Gammaproteobacteria bacterium]|nr:hypothetical protein [Archangium sp.]MDP2139772.1 hypothetical protein [Gammaproteobacteria bacterium]
MPVLNRDLLRVLAMVHHQQADATVGLVDGPTQRTLHVVRGNLVSVASNSERDRLAEMLVMEGRLDPALLIPLREEAERLQKPFSEQLLHDELLSPTELAGALERLALLRFERALTMLGRPGPFARPAALRPIVNRPLGALVVEFFRDRIPIESIEQLLEAEVERYFEPGRLTPQALNDLRLMPGELRLARRLAAGERPAHVVAGGPESTARFVCSMIALRHSVTR